MGQSRIQDYGSPVVARSLKTLVKSLVRPTRLQGLDFIVDAPDRLRITPGNAVTDQGVIISETEAKVIPITNSSNPVDYTIYYAHVDADISGGVSADLTIDTGLLTAEVVDGVILGYIRYPGGAVPLSSVHFVQTPPLSIGTVAPSREEANWTIPTSTYGFLKTAASGQALTYTDVFDVTPPNIYLKVRNNGLVSGTATLTFPFKVGAQPFSLFQIRLSTDINTTATPVLVDSAGTSFTLGSSPYTGAPTIAYQEARIPRDSMQTPNTLIYVQLLLSASAAREIKIQALGLNRFNAPV